MKTMENNLLKTMIQLLDEKKGEDIAVFDFEGVSAYFDYFIVVSGDNPRHMKSLGQHLLDKAHELGMEAKAEGMNSEEWILLDLGGIIIHVFSREKRSFYNLDKLWLSQKTTF